MGFLALFDPDVAAGQLKRAAEVASDKGPSWKKTQKGIKAACDALDLGKRLGPKEAAATGEEIDKLRDSIGTPSDYTKLQQALQNLVGTLPDRNPSGSSYRGQANNAKLVLVDVSKPAENLGAVTNDKDRESWLNDRVLYCHYNPQTIVERVRPNYLVSAPLPGSFVQGMIFRWMEPRQIQLRLFFNDWGEPRYAPFISTDKSIEWLKAKASIPPLTEGNFPFDSRSLRSGKGRGGQEHTHWTIHPPEIWLKGSSGLDMIGVISRLTIRHLKMSTWGSLSTIRAEVDLELTQQAFATTPLFNKNNVGATAPSNRGGVQYGGGYGVSPARVP